MWLSSAQISFINELINNNYRILLLSKKGKTDTITKTNNYNANHVNFGIRYNKNFKKINTQLIFYKNISNAATIVLQ